MSQWLIILFGSLLNQFWSQLHDPNFVRKLGCHTFSPKDFRVLDYVSGSHQFDLSKLCKHWDIFLSHCMSSLAYKILLGWPFNIITESLVKNEKDISQTLTLTDPNMGERCVMHTCERGKVLEILKQAVKQDFWQALMKHCWTAERLHW